MTPRQKETVERIRAAKSKRVVRGPQKQLVFGPAVDAKADKGRTPRMRYIERPNKKDGNPFFALRVPQPMLEAMLRAATKAKKYRTQWARDILAKACGYKYETADNGGES